MKVYKTTMKVTIRPAATNDLQGILAIVNHAILNTTAIYDYEPRTIEAQRLWFDDKVERDLPVIIAEAEDKIVGFASYGAFNPKVGYRMTVEHSVYVADGFSGNGVGKQLLAELIALAKAQKIHVMVGLIDASNIGSIAFHRKFEFTENGILKEVGFKFGKWLDVQFMQLILY